MDTRKNMSYDQHWTMCISHPRINTLIIPTNACYYLELRSALMSHSEFEFLPRKVQIGCSDVLKHE